MKDLTTREYAAIKLRVPNSGSAVIDTMIIKSRQMDFAGQILAARMAEEIASELMIRREIEKACEIADTLIESLKL